MVAATAIQSSSSRSSRTVEDHDDDHNNDQNDDQEHIEAVADSAAAVLFEQQQALTSATSAPPAPLPLGWVLRESRTHPNYYYYYNQETGESSWDTPWVVPSTGAPTATAEDVTSIANAVALALASSAAAAAAAAAATAAAIPTATVALTSPSNDNNNTNSNNDTESSEYDTSAKDNSTSSRKRPSLDTNPSVTENNRQSSSSSKRTKVSTTERPSKVRILHILKKHKDARRPSSWRRPVITITRDEAVVELQSLLDILHEVQDDPDELRATFEELARTESDCSSAKRGGDLGYFGPKKMQPAFEDASFQLSINELSNIVETSSGVHILLRIG